MCFSYNIEISLPNNIVANNILTTSVGFSWSSVTCSGSCPDGITGYSYNLDEDATGTRIASGTTGANETMVTITGLAICTEYLFYVAGISGSIMGTYGTESVTTSWKG